MILGKIRSYAFAFTSVVALASIPLPVDAAGVSDPQAQFGTITPAQLAAELRQKDFVLVNVHMPYEGEIEQTDLFIPFDQIADHLADLPADKSAGIVLYCRSGRMSEIAASTLARLGYTGVTHVADGMNGWAKLGLDLLHR